MEKKVDSIPDSKEKELQEKKQEEASVKNRYYQELNIWEKAGEPIKQKRDEYIRSAVEKKAQNVKEELENKYTSERNALKSDIQSLENDIQKANSELAGLSIFKIKRKPELKKY